MRPPLCRLYQPGRVVRGAPCWPMRGGAAGTVLVDRETCGQGSWCHGKQALRNHQAELPSVRFRVCMLVGVQGCSCLYLRYVAMLPLRRGARCYHRYGGRRTQAHPERCRKQAAKQPPLGLPASAATLCGWLRQWRAVQRIRVERSVRGWVSAGVCCAALSLAPMRLHSPSLQQSSRCRGDCGQKPAC